jgi:hypothetical protein
MDTFVGIIFLTTAKHLLEGTKLGVHQQCASCTWTLYPSVLLVDAWVYNYDPCNAVVIYIEICFVHNQTS